MSALAAAAAFALGWLLLPARSASRVAPAAPARRSPPDVLAHPRAPVAAGFAVATPVVGLAGPAVAVACGVLAWALAVELRTSLLDRARVAESAGWGAALRGLSVALAAGGVLPDALDRGGAAARALAPGGAALVLPAVAAVARVGGDPVDDLDRRAVGGPGARLVAALSLSATAGVAPAPLADRVASSVTADERAGRAATVALSGAQATTRLLAVLPIAGIGLAASFGASAPAFLLSSSLGHGCLLAAAVLEVAGLRWSARIMTGARR